MHSAGLDEQVSQQYLVWSHCTGEATEVCHSSPDLVAASAAMRPAAENTLVSEIYET